MEYDYYNYSKQYENLEIKEFDKVLICGMGGSGIVGDFLQILLDKKIIFTCKDYRPPNFIHKDWLAILISYSGDTEETISCLEKLPTDNIVIIAGGGKMEEIAKEKGYYFVKIPKIFPATRFAFPVILSASLSILDKGKYYTLLDLLKDVNKKIKIFEKVEDKINNPVIIYTDYYHYPVAFYFKVGLNEDAKHFAKYSILPEDNHHELEALNKLPFDFIFLKFNYNNRIFLRYKFVKDLLIENGNNVIELDLTYGNLFEELLYGSISLEQLSLNLAKRKGIDPYKNTKIPKLKKYMSEFK